MAMTYKYWIEEGGKSIPDTDEFFTDTLCVPREIETSNNKFKIASKDDIRKVYKRSPTLFDATMLTFAYPVRKRHADLKKLGRTNTVKAL